jgi:NAD(P)-dependent dehydrogenase (short-subunit alcohol dehydrogenase family)
MSMQGMRVLVTGATNGIGQAAALELARMGAEVLIVGRDSQRTQSTAENIRRTVPGARVDTFLADLSSLEQVRKLASEVRGRYDRLDVLLNNAGAAFTERRVTADGLEMTFALNHLAYFLLTHLLMPLLEAAPSARIVNVGSAAANVGKIHFDDLQGERGYNGARAYCQSKLANFFFTQELARRLKNTRITTFVMDPGPVASGFGAEAKGLAGMVLKVLRPFLRTPEKGSRTLVYLASEPGLESSSGDYFIDTKKRKPPRQTQDEAVARRLWEVSEQLTGLAIGSPSSASGAP